MTLKETLAKLESLGNDATYKHNLKNGAGENQFGVKMGDIRALAKTIKKDHPLALDLWKTGNADAQFLAILIFDLKKITAADLDTMVRSIVFTQVADWFYSYVIKDFAGKEALREKWWNDAHPIAARAGWSLTAGRVAREPGGLDLKALLERIEKEMPNAPPQVQWTMNSTLAQIGINFPEHRKRAISIGEKLGIYRDYPVSKGCTSPFAPVWIGEMVKRQGG